MTPESKKVHEERKKFYKMLLTPSISLDERMGILGDLPDQDLEALLDQFTSDEEFEICQVIKAVLDKRKSDKNSN